jgi:hypothetical protein
MGDARTIRLGQSRCSGTVRFCLLTGKTHRLRPVLRKPNSPMDDSRLAQITNHELFAISHDYPCELVITWAARKIAAKSSTTMRQYTVHRSMAGTPRMSASRPLDVDV